MQRIKLSTLVVIFFILISCKKETKVVTANSNIVGTWHMYMTFNNLLTGNITVNDSQYPCIKNNVLTFNADFTETQNYSGKDTCFIVPVISGQPKVWWGYPNQPVSAGTWSNSGSTVSLHVSKTEYGTLSNSNGQFYLKFKDTLITGKDTALFEDDYVKQ